MILGLSKKPKGKGQRLFVVLVGVQFVERQRVIGPFDEWHKAAAYIQRIGDDHAMIAPLDPAQLPREQH